MKCKCVARGWVWEVGLDRSSARFCSFKHSTRLHKCVSLRNWRRRGMDTIMKSCEECDRVSQINCTLSYELIKKTYKHFIMHTRRFVCNEKRSLAVPKHTSKAEKAELYIYFFNLFAIEVGKLKLVCCIHKKKTNSRHTGALSRPVTRHSRAVVIGSRELYGRHLPTIDTIFFSLQRQSIFP